MGTQIKIFRFNKESGQAAAIVVDNKSGQNTTVSGQVQQELEAQAFVDVAVAGALPLPEKTVRIHQKRPRRGGPVESDEKPDADAIAPEALAQEFEEMFGKRALQFGGFHTEE